LPKPKEEHRDDGSDRGKCELQPSTLVRKMGSLTTPRRNATLDTPCAARQTAGNGRLAVESAENRRLPTANDSYGQPWECMHPRRGASKKGDTAWNDCSGSASQAPPAPAPVI
jgi:hypothetical protein